MVWLDYFEDAPLCSQGRPMATSVDVFAEAVPKGSYTVYYDSSMEYKLNAFSAESSLFYNPTTEQEFYFIQNEPICYDGLFNTRSVFSSFLILNDEDYHTIAAALANEYKAVSYMVNVENWQDTMDFQNNILQAVIAGNNRVIFTNIDKYMQQPSHYKSFSLISDK